ncbi:hypothetical protein E2320_018360 [Naja naja]|nr:hypothetical protein E2320_018360 [Naja naja]
MAPRLPPFLRSLFRYRTFIALFGTPLVLLPLPLLIATKEARCGYVIILMAVYWCTEVIPLAVTALLPVILFPLFGILESKKVCMQYLKDTNMLFIGGLIVAVAVEHWNLHKRIALRVLLIVGVKPALLMLGFMGVTAFLSMWISNTATTAMMVPIIQAVLDQMNNSEHDLAVMESTAGHINNAIELEGKVATEASSVQGNGYLPDDSREQERIARKRINKGMTLCVCYAASIGGTATLTGTGPNLVLKGQMNHFRKTWGCGSKKSEKDKAALNVLKEEYRKLGPISFAEINVLMVFTLLILLWFTRDPGFIPGWATVLFNKEKEYVTDATVAIFVALLLFILPSTRPRCGFCSQNSCDLEEAEEAYPALSTDMKEPFFPAPLLDWNTVQKKLPWSIVLLLGGGFALANGSDASGLSKWLGNQMTPLQTIPPWAIAVVLSIVIAIFTECTSNVATATLFLPVFASLSQSIEVNPLYIMIPGTLSASFAFMLPVATPPNAIVFSYGHLHVADMVKTGIVMNIIGVICITLAINTWGRFMFHLDTFPSWANGTLGK